MGWTELAAAALGVVNVALVVRRSVWNYPFGIAMVALYFFVFAEARLYSDALLQIFFLAVQLYGWRNWVMSPKTDGGVAVERMAAWRRLLWLAGAGAASTLWGLGMARFTDAAAPFADALIAGFSVSAQLLQSLRRIESWVLWIGVDALAIGVYLSRGLTVTAALYALFLVMSCIGLWSWWRQLRAAPVRGGSAA
ncbi:MAG TPA: nicotinamide riboside transporter PnuC [Allosphingosinicella sp.]|nr:nicotinamide riboside transporter PnuC [Allosphingosinicella sp.]